MDGRGWGARGGEWGDELKSFFLSFSLSLHGAYLSDIGNTYTRNKHIFNALSKRMVLVHQTTWRNYLKLQTSFFADGLRICAIASGPQTWMSLSVSAC